MRAKVLMRSTGADRLVVVKKKVSVMEMERRGWIVQLCLMDQPAMGGIFLIK